MAKQSSSSSTQIVIRVALLAVLIIALIALFVDRRARSSSQQADAQLSERDAAGELMNAATVQELIGREPTSSREVGGGLIENYDFSGGIPGRSFTIRVGYAPGANGEMVYVAHNLNQEQGEMELQQLIAAQGNRLALPPVDDP
jgi:hypothetical protein